MTKRLESRVRSGQESRQPNPLATSLQKFVVKGPDNKVLVLGTFGRCDDYLHSRLRRRSLPQRIR